MVLGASLLLVAIPVFEVEAYGQGYYQAYYQSYYQGYYEGTYNTTFTKPVVMKKNATITGSISKGSGTFVIDHPLDPKNMLLFHSFVESPDVKNIYDGVVQLDTQGEAVVKLPSYFMALNKDFRYLLTPVGASMPDLHVGAEIVDNAFTIGGGSPRGSVSWQVTGIRHDAYILANPIIVEVDKSSSTLAVKGQYLFNDYNSSPSIVTRLASLIQSMLRLVGVN